MSKRVKAAAVSTVLLMGCAGEPASQEPASLLQPDMEPRQVMEEADRVDAKLGSYVMVITENYPDQTGAPETRTETDYLEFVNDLLYTVTRFQDGSFQIEKLVLENADRHGLDGSSLKVREGKISTFDSRGQCDGVYPLSEYYQAEDYISIPSAALRKDNSFRTVSADESRMEIEVSGVPAPYEMPDRIKTVMTFVFDQNLHLIEMDTEDTDQDQTVLYRKVQEFSSFNEKKINTDAVDAWLDQPSNENSEKQPFTEIEQFLLS